MPACVRLRSAVDFGSGHPEACARTVCKQCFTDSQRVVEADNGHSLISGRPCFYFGQGKARNVLDWSLRVEDKIKDRNVM